MSKKWGMFTGLALCWWLFSAFAMSQVPAPRPTVLTPGKPLSQKLVKGEKPVFQVRLQANQYCRVLVDQQGVDVVVVLRSPSQTELLKVDSPNGIEGSEALEFISESTGVYLVEVAGADESAPSGAYSIQVVEARTASPADRERVRKLGVIRAKLAETAQLEATPTKANGEKAIALYQEVIQLHQDLHNEIEKAWALNNLGQNHGRMGENAKAIACFTEALDIHRRTKGRCEEALVLYNLGEAWRETGDFHQAQELFLQAAALADRIPMPQLAIYTYSILGTVSNALGDLVAAAKYFNLALDHCRARGDQAGEANVLHNFGSMYDDLGEKEKAGAYYRQALVLERQTNDRQGESYSLNNLALIEDFRGEFQQALEGFHRVRQLTQELGDKHLEGTVLLNLGQTHRNLGEYDATRTFYTQALELFQSLQEDAGTAAALQKLGYLEFKEDHPAQAQLLFQKALTLQLAGGDKKRAAANQGMVGETWLKLGDIRQAKENLAASLALQRSVQNRDGEGQALMGLGQAAFQEKDFAQAVDAYQQALAIRRALRDRTGETETLYHLTQAQLGREKPELALESIAAAARLVETGRLKVNRESLRQSFFANQRDIFDLYIDVLMRLHRKNPTAGFAGQALEVSERGRARGLIELLAAARRNNGTPPSHDLVAQEQTLLTQLDLKEQERFFILATRETSPILSQLEKDITVLQTQLEEMQARLRTQNQRLASLVYPAPLTVRGIQEQVLDRDSILLEYSLGAGKSYLWAVTITGVTAFELPGREQIEALAATVYQSLKEPRAQRDIGLGGKKPGPMKPNWQREAAQLSGMILGPVGSKLGSRRLVLVPDGALEYIPFGALPMRGTGPYVPLLATHEIVTLPSASTLAVLRRETAGRKPAEKQLAVFADPVFGTQDERLKKQTTPPQKKTEESVPSPSLSPTDERALKLLVAGQNPGEPKLQIPRLPFTRQEAQALETLVHRNNGIRPSISQPAKKRQLAEKLAVTK
ncbi:MAG: tetratricopeptide repeat protein [Blastocatellia bacterium]|nr:tetratricopeptide repeat protein [Blastocatellia bacterium]